MNINILLTRMNRTKDFDVTKGTILESALRPEQLDEVTNSIFNISQRELQ